MAAFYGQVEGNRGAASRTGSLNSGIQTKAESYEGSVSVWLHELDGQVIVDVDVDDGSGRLGTRFRGTLGELKAKLEG